MHSIFSDIFDELHFIETLRGDVKIIKELPQELANVPRARKHFTSWASTSYYEDMTQLWKEYQVNVSVAVQHLEQKSGRLSTFLQLL